MSNIYREEILEHSKNPQNFGKLSGADFIVEEDNPLCGDSQIWYIKLAENTKTPSYAAYSAKVASATKAGKASAGRQKHENNIIQDLRFISEGCAISTAAGSLLSEFIKGKSLDDLKNLNNNDMIKLFKVKLTPSRMNCLMLPLKALKKIYTNS